MADEQVSDPEADRALGKMSFMEHLGELRTRIMWSLASAGVGLAIALFFTKPVMRYLIEHIIRVKPVFTSPTEAFWTYMKIALILGVFISMPALLWQVWKFVAPGLHQHEKRYAAPFVLVSSVLFLLGGAFALFLVVPFAMRFVLKFTLAFGLVFELPVVITILSMIGVVTPQFLAQKRKYAILINFIIAAILTPTPDIFNQTLMAAPMCLLYEIGIICARVFGRKPTIQPVPTAASGDS